MRTTYVTILGIAVLGFCLSVNAFAQEPGAYRSVTDGNWNAGSTWETYAGGSWVPAIVGPGSTEMVTIRDTVWVNVPVTVEGRVRVEDGGELNVTTGSLRIADGGVYEHARDGGDLPDAMWAAGSTYLLTGTVQDAPGNRNQDFHHVVVNTPELGRNRDLGLDDVTIGGDLRFVTTGENRWQLSSASGGDSAVVTIRGDVLVEDGQVAVQGTGNALTTFIVHHYGDIEVTGGNFSAARGSQGSGSGTTTWYLYDGDFTMRNATTQNSNPTPGAAKYVFAGNGTQRLDFQNVDYGGQAHFEVSDSTTLDIFRDFELNGLLVNRGEVEPQGTFTVADGGTYEHARDGGDLPDAEWEEGATLLLTGTEQDAPGNRNQNFHHVVFNTPDLGRNRDMGWNGITIGGDIRVIDTGSARWYLTSASAGDAATVTLMGDVIIEGGQFSVQGTGNANTTFVVDHYGDIEVTGGNFSISRGSQGSGSGTTTWNLHEGDFSMANARTQNSNPELGAAKFVFAGDGTQVLTLARNNTIDNLSIEVSSSTTLDMGTSELTGSGFFSLQEGATLATAHEGGVGVFGAIQSAGFFPFDSNYIFNGTTPQVTSIMLPATVHDLVIDNAAGVALSQETTITGTLRLVSGVFDNSTPFTLADGATISREGGSLLVTTAAEPTAEVPAAFALHQNYPNPFNPSTVIRYDLKERAHVTVKVYDATGRQVAELVNEQLGAGNHQVEWNAGGLSSGVYFYHIRAGSWSATRSLQLVK